MLVLIMINLPASFLKDKLTHRKNLIIVLKIPAVSILSKNTEKTKNKIIKFPFINSNLPKRPLIISLNQLIIKNDLINHKIKSFRKL